MSVVPISPAEPSNTSLSLAVSVDSAINYAFQQNAIPVVKELRFQNDRVTRKVLVIRVSTEPAFAAPTETRRQDIVPKRSANLLELPSLSIRRKMKP